MIKGYTWSTEQLRAIETVDSSVIVSASAGSGKTTLMIERILRLIANGTPLERMLVVTFATAQAEDMKNKLAFHLTQAAQDVAPELAAHLRKQNFSLSAASISTLHSYCADFVRRNAYAVDVDPAFVISAESDSEIRKQTAVEQVVRAAIRKGDGTFNRLYDALLEKRKHAGLSRMIRKIAELNATLADVSLRDLTSKGVAQAQDDYMAYFSWGCRTFAARYREIAVRADAPDYQALYCLERAEWCDKNCATARPKARLVVPKNEVDNEETKAQIKAINEKLDNLIKGYNAILQAPESQDEFAECLISLTEEYEETYRALKMADGVLDFNDLERYAYTLLQDPTVAENERNRFDYVFVDEFQDINPLQQAILATLSRDNVFMVGDVKQSIYGFRLCDSSIFQSEYARMTLRGTAVDLNANYRSARNILGFCNFIFGEIFTEELGGLDYRSRAAFRGGSEGEGTVEVHLVHTQSRNAHVDADEVYSVRDDSGATDAATRGYNEGKLIASRIASLLSHPDEDKRVEPKEIAVLTRTMRAETFALIAALRDAGIPVSVRRDLNLFESPAVCALINLLRVLVNPRQDYALLGVMTSALFDFTEQELAAIRLSHKGVAFHQAVYGYATLPDGSADGTLRAKVRAMTEALREWSALARYETPYAVLMHAMSRTDYLTAVLAREQGDAEHDLVQYFCKELYASRHNTTAVAYLAFVSACDKLTVEVTEGATDAVTVTTIHKSKGLEWKAVFVALLGRNYRMQDLMGVELVNKRYGVILQNFDFAARNKVKNKTYLAALPSIRRDLMAEELRILYVALTRAKSFLALVGTDLFAKPIGKTDAFARLTARSPLELIAGVLATDPSNRHIAELDVSGGATPQCHYSITVHEDGTLAKPVDPPAVTGADGALVATLKDYWAKLYPYATDTLQKTTATLRADAVAVTVERDATGFVRDGEATEVGNAYHEIMQYIDFDTQDVRAEIDRIVREGKTSAERAGLVDAERIALACKAVAALGGSARRELGFLSTVDEASLYGKGDGKVVVQGIIDLLIETDGGVLVVDYKTTDGSAEYLRERYTAQLDTYADACRKAGMTVLEKRIWSFVHNAWVDCG